MPTIRTIVPGPDTERDFRNALGRFTTGVTVVTTTTDSGPIGITVNSFASVSMDPALVMWCPARASTRYRYFAEAKHFAIHVMAEEQEDTATGFALSGRAFDGLDVSLNAHRVPLIGGCLARFECTTTQTHDAGDHLIVVGQVTRAMLREGKALVFCMGKYGRFMGV